MYNAYTKMEIQESAVRRRAGRTRVSFGRVAREVFPEEFRENPKKAADRARQLYRSFEKRFLNAELRREVWEFVTSEEPPREKNPT